MMRVFLFLVSNIAILFLLSVVISIFGVGHTSMNKDNIRVHRGNRSNKGRFPSVVKT